MIAPFQAPKLKLARAGQHISELEAKVSAYWDEKPYRVVVEQPAELKNVPACAFVTKIRKAVPVELSGPIGDAVHNLRAALDLLACDLVRLNGGSAKSVHFPFAASAEGLEGQIKAKNFRSASPACVDLLRHLQPYTGGNDALRGIHDLDIQDKHSALIPAVSAARIEQFTLKVGDNLNQIPPWESTVPRDGWWMMVVPELEDVAIGTEIGCKFTLVFDHDAPFAGREIIPLLRSLTEYVTSVVKSFETLCKGQTFPEIAPGKGSSKALIIGEPVKPRYTSPVTMHR